MEKRFQTFTLQITRIARSIRKIKAEEMKEYNLKSPHVSCLYYLYINDAPMTSKELCDMCDEDKAAISRSLEYLEQNDFLKCESKSEKRYKAPLYLTEKGKKIGKDIVRKIDGVLKVSNEGLTEQEMATFYKSLKLISDNLKKISDKYGD